ncbi:MAG: tRNA uridine-5-carboxymethylaminomethyl(34) synthesis GTPase MnmE [Gemmatimonadetes bacterium]|nr:tRNA uridine-5-carboxymethylaminomethyl(34) synthesis GTPase MnmE [Gemmatimonadota bacterium]
MGARARSGDVRGDLIAAVATAQGRGALAVVRMSGPGAAAAAARVLAPWPPVPRRATRVRVHACDAPAEPLDDALATHFPAPASFTGEDVVELSVHGGRYVAAAVLAALVEAGARPALPGEFTERAVRNGKLDLLQAEAVADLIDARSRAMHRAALRQLSGALSHRLGALRDALIEVEALIAYEVDFPEEDDGPQPRARAAAAAARVVAELDSLLATLPRAELGRDGVTVVLAGAPNTGKSSLFNALAGDPRAIVSEVPGTTRDALEVLVDHSPWPLRLVDTAGLRASDDVVERLGIEVSARRLAMAHLVLVCAERDADLQRTCAEVAALSGAPRIAVRTKSDLRTDGRGRAAPADGEVEVLAPHTALAVVEVSAATGAGLDALRAAITDAMTAITPDPDEELPVVTRARQAAALRAARDEVVAFTHAWEAGELPAPVVGTHLRAAVHALDELLGGIDVDDVLDRVFRTFCVGK